MNHLRDSLRVVVAFEGQQRAWILLVGRHDDQDPVLNVYAELYRLLGVEPPDSTGRDKPPCCDQNTDLPPVLGAAVTELVDRAARVRRTRRRWPGGPALPSLKRRPNKCPILMSGSLAVVTLGQARYWGSSVLRTMTWICLFLIRLA